MTWMAVAVGGAAVIGAAGSAYASNQASGAQSAAAQNTANMDRRNMLMQLQLQEPQRNLGYQAMGDLSSLYGYSQTPYTPASQLANNLNPLTAKQIKQLTKNGASFDQIAQMGTLGTGKKSINRLIKAGYTPEQINQLRTGIAPQQQAQPTAQPTGQPGNMSRFFTSPDYQFRLNEGQRDIGNSFAARGGAASGNALRALSQFNQGLASGEYGNYVNRLMQMSGLGSAANNNVAQAGQNYANNYGQTQQQAGDARASGVMGAANGISGAINGGLNTWLMSKYLSGGKSDQYSWLQPVSITAPKIGG